MAVMWLHRWADTVTRKQLVRALAARDRAEAERRAAVNAQNTQVDITNQWRDIALTRSARLAAVARVRFNAIGADGRVEQLRQDGADVAEAFYAGSAWALYAVRRVIEAQQGEPK